jgi:hypothetical protein
MVARWPMEVALLPGADNQIVLLIKTKCVLGWFSGHWNVASQSKLTPISPDALHNVQTKQQYPYILPSSLPLWYYCLWPSSKYATSSLAITDALLVPHVHGWYE